MATEDSDAALAELEALASTVGAESTDTTDLPHRKPTKATKSKKQSAIQETAFPGIEEEPYDPADTDDQPPPAQTYTAEDGTKYYWDVYRGMWLPQVDEELLRQQQAIYGGTPSEPVTKTKKRKPKKKEAKANKSSESSAPQLNKSK
jgi:hypothetical protein